MEILPQASVIPYDWNTSHPNSATAARSVSGVCAEPPQEKRRREERSKAGARGCATMRESMVLATLVTETHSRSMRARASGAEKVRSMAWRPPQKETASSSEGGEKEMGHRDGGKKAVGLIRMRKRGVVLSFEKRNQNTCIYGECVHEMEHRSDVSPHIAGMKAMLDDGGQRVRDDDAVAEHDCLGCTSGARSKVHVKGVLRLRQAADHAEEESYGPFCLRCWRMSLMRAQRTGLNLTSDIGIPPVGARDRSARRHRTASIADEYGCIPSNRHASAKSSSAAAFSAATGAAERFALVASPEGDSHITLTVDRPEKYVDNASPT